MRKIIALVGPTAVGKTKYAIHAAKKIGGEILSADSMQIYKGMDIGSAKPDSDELKAVPHHMVGEISPFDQWSVADYQREAKKRIEDIFERGKQPIVSGGTGLYVNSLIYEMDFASFKGDAALRTELQNLADRSGGEALYERLRRVDPNAASRLHPNNIKKLIRAIEVAESTGRGVENFNKSFIKNADYESIVIGLNRPRKILYKRIENRVDEMMESGLLEEVKSLMAAGLTEEYNSMKGIGYKELLLYFNGDCSLEEAVNLIKQRSRNYAKRQMTWFRRYDNIKWFNISEGEDLCCTGDEIVEAIRSLTCP